MSRRLERPVLPQPSGDLQAWASSLVKVLTDSLVKIQTVTDILPIMDKDGNVIVDENGVFVYSADGGTISSQEVSITGEQITGLPVEKVSGLGALATKDTVGTSDISPGACTANASVWAAGPKAVGSGWTELAKVTVSGGSRTLLVAGANLLFGGSPTAFRLRRGSTVLAGIDITVGFMQGPLVFIDNPPAGTVQYTLEAMAAGAANCVSISLMAVELKR